MISQEKVLVVPRPLFDSLGSFQGLKTGAAEVERYLTPFLDPAHHSFVPRSAAEEDPTLKQIIPYIVLTCGDRILEYRRGSGSGEKRLLKKRSLGIGGHINDEDGAGAPNMPSYSTEAVDCGVASVLAASSTLCTLSSSAPESPGTSSPSASLKTYSHFNAVAYQRALLRELEEELQLPSSFQQGHIKAVALLNDDSNPVGAVHLGIVHQCTLLSEEVTAKEEAIAELGFMTYEECEARIEEFENWSQIVIRNWKGIFKPL